LPLRQGRVYAARLSARACIVKFEHRQAAPPLDRHNPGVPTAPSTAAPACTRLA